MWCELKLRRRLPLRGVRVGEAAHPGPPDPAPVLTKQRADREAKNMKQQLAWLERAALECEAGECADKGRAALEKAREYEKLLKEWAGTVEVVAERPVVCPLCDPTGPAIAADAYRAHFVKEHLCACLTPEAECVPEVEEGPETRENEAVVRAAKLHEALEKRGRELRHAMRRALRTGDGKELVEELKGLEVAEFRQREEGVPLGSPADVVDVGLNFARRKQAANLRLADALRAAAAVVQAPEAPEAARRKKNKPGWVKDGLPNGAECLKEALERDLGKDDSKYGQTKLGRMLLHLKVGGGTEEKKESEQVASAWLAAVQGAIILLGGCKPAVVRASFQMTATEARSRLCTFVGSDAVHRADDLIGHRVVLRAMHLGMQDPECRVIEDEQEGAERPGRHVLALEGPRVQQLALEDAEAGARVQRLALENAEAARGSDAEEEAEARPEEEAEAAAPVAEGARAAKRRRGRHEDSPKSPWLGKPKLVAGRLPRAPEMPFAPAWPGPDPDPDPENDKGMVPPALQHCGTH